MRPSLSSRDASSITDNEILGYLRKLRAVRLWIVACFSKVGGLDIELDADLLQGLKNGILLCYLVQYFKPWSVPRINEKASDVASVAKWRENIVFFLAACEQLGVPRAKLFRVNDLSDGQSMVNVVDCLLALSAAVEESWPDRFPSVTTFLEIDDEVDDALLLASLDSQERFRIAVQLVQRMKSVAMHTKDVKRSEGYRLSLIAAGDRVSARVRESNSEEVVEVGITRLQALCRATEARTRYHTRLRDAAYRERVAFEILDTEKAYVESLGTCVDVYLRPLLAAVEAGKPIISQEKIDAIFGELESVWTLSRRFLLQLEERLGRWYPNLLLADVFVSIESHLDTYTAFIQNYTEAVRLFKRAARRKKTFKEFLLRQKNDVRSRGRELDQFLIMPVQRIPRYSLLLRELVKHTWESHPDFEALDAGVERLAKIGMFLNEKKREAEALQRTFYVQEILDAANTGLQVALAGRRYMYEGEVYDASGRQVMAFLFSDMLVTCWDKNDRQHTEADERRAASRRKIRFNEAFTLSADMSVVALAPDASVCEGRAGLALTLPSSRQQLNLYCSASAAKEWIESIQAVQAKLSVLATLRGPTVPAVDGKKQSRLSGSAHTLSSASTSGSSTSSGSSGSTKTRRSHGRNKSLATAIPDFGDDGLPLRSVPSLDHSGPLPAPVKGRFLGALVSPRGKADSSEGIDRRAKARMLGGASPILDSDAEDEEPKKGSIRGKLGAVIRLTQLNRLFDKEREDASPSPPPIAPSPEHTAAVQFRERSPRPDSSDTEGDGSARKLRETEQLSNLSKLMQGKTRREEDSLLESGTEVSEGTPHGSVIDDQP